MTSKEAAGTFAFRRLATVSCEGKRFYVRPQHRGRGVGKSLLSYAIEEARSAGYEEMYGDTLESMTSALQMYRDMGFREVPPYAPNPTPAATYLKLTLI